MSLAGATDYNLMAHLFETETRRTFCLRGVRHRACTSILYNPSIFETVITAL